MIAALTKELLENDFGTEAALGIRYVDEEKRVWTPDELDAHYLKHGAPPSGSLESEFPDGSDAVRCTHYAMQIAKKYPERTQIFGFLNEANPDCEIVKRGLHPGGHDFAVVDQRWLIDPWVRLVCGAFHEIILDLDDREDAILALARYGGRENWKRMVGAEEASFA
jgi:hypothetical protein